MKVHPFPLANSNSHLWLTMDQINAILDRDYILATKLGVSFNTYMSCIDPDYPRWL